MTSLDARVYGASFVNSGRRHWSDVTRDMMKIESKAVWRFISQVPQSCFHFSSVRMRMVSDSFNLRSWASVREIAGVLATLPPPRNINKWADKNAYIYGICLLSDKQINNKWSTNDFIYGGANSKCPYKMINSFNQHTYILSICFGILLITL